MQKLQDKRILLVEDESLIALDVMNELQGEGAAVSVVPTVTAALIAIQSAPIDAAVVDHALQDGDGSEVCRKLHEKQIPFVTYSGHLQLSGECQMAPHVSKPAVPGEIAQAIARLF